MYTLIQWKTSTSVLQSGNWTNRTVEAKVCTIQKTMIPILSCKNVPVHRKCPVVASLFCAILCASVSCNMTPCGWGEMLCGWHGVPCGWGMLPCEWGYVHCAWGISLFSWSDPFCGWSSLPSGWGYLFSVGGLVWVMAIPFGVCLSHYNRI